MRHETVLEWYGSWTPEEQGCLRDIILNHPATEVQPALEKWADFPFSVTTLKSLRQKLRAERDGSILD